MRRAGKARGFTLVEIMVALFVGALMIGVISQTMLVSQRAIQTEALEIELQNRASAILDQMVVDLTSSSFNQMEPNPLGSSGSTYLNFKQCLGWSGGAKTGSKVWSDWFSYKLEAVVHGTEKSLVINKYVPGAEGKQQIIALTDPAVDARLLFTRTGDSMLIRVSLERTFRPAGGEVSVSRAVVSTALKPRD